MGPSCPYFRWRTRAPTGLDLGFPGSPAGWRSSAGEAAPSRYTGGTDRTRSWPLLSADPEPRGWRRPVFEMDSTQVKRSDRSRTGQRWKTQMAVQKPSFCHGLVNVWCHCNICWTSSRLCEGSSLLWYTLWTGREMSHFSTTIKKNKQLNNMTAVFTKAHTPDNSCLINNRTER